MSRVKVCRCPSCGAWTPARSATRWGSEYCIVCGDDIGDDDDELFDADELGLDPEDDERRAYGA